MTKIDSVVEDNRKVSKDTHVLEIRMELESTPSPGQYVLVYPSQDFLLPRPFSIYQYDKDRKSLSLLIRKVGRASRYLSDLRAGDSICLTTPMGNSFMMPEGKRVLLVAGGVGIAPLAFYKQRFPDATLVYGERSRSYIVIECISKCYIYTTDDGTAGYRGSCVDAAAELLKSETFDVILACGPSPMLEGLYKRTRKAVKRAFFSVEEVMGCGMGVCLSCMVDTKEGQKYICKEGPVFDADILYGDDLC